MEILIYIKQEASESLKVSLHINYEQYKLFLAHRDVTNRNPSVRSLGFLLLLRTCVLPAVIAQRRHVFFCGSPKHLQYSSTCTYSSTLHFSVRWCFVALLNILYLNCLRPDLFASGRRNVHAGLVAGRQKSAVTRREASQDRMYLFSEPRARAKQVSLCSAWTISSFLVKCGVNSKNKERNNGAPWSIYPCVAPRDVNHIDFKAKWPWRRAEPRWHKWVPSRPCQGSASLKHITAQATYLKWLCLEADAAPRARTRGSEHAEHSHTHFAPLSFFVCVFSAAFTVSPPSEFLLTLFVNTPFAVNIKGLTNPSVSLNDAECIRDWSHLDPA